MDSEFFGPSTCLEPRVYRFALQCQLELATFASRTAIVADEGNRINFEEKRGGA